MLGADEERERGEEQESRRPRVVDKRVAARGAPSEASGTAAPGPPEPPAAPPPQTPPRPTSPASEPAAPQAGAPSQDTPPEPGGPTEAPTERVWTPEQEAEARRAAEEMAAVPARDWVLNVAVTLANVAGVKIQDGQLEDAQLAIDALSGMIDKIEGEMGEAAPLLRQTLAQLQMAYAQSASPPAQPPQ